MTFLHACVTRRFLAVQFISYFLKCRPPPAHCPKNCRASTKLRRDSAAKCYLACDTIQLLFHNLLLATRPATLVRLDLVRAALVVYSRISTPCPLGGARAHSRPCFRGFRIVRRNKSKPFRSQNVLPRDRIDDPFAIYCVQRTDSSGFIESGNYVTVAEIQPVNSLCTRLLRRCTYGTRLCAVSVRVWRSELKHLTCRRRRWVRYFIFSWACSFVGPRTGFPFFHRDMVPHRGHTITAAAGAAIARPRSEAILCCDGELHAK